jgi:hypothetical protein
MQQQEARVRPANHVDEAAVEKVQASTQIDNRPYY